MRSSGLANSQQGRSGARRLLVVASVGESLIGAGALSWIRLRGLGLEVGALVVGSSAGLGAACLLVLANYFLINAAPPVEPVQAIRRFYQETLQPLFAEATLFDVIGISLAAGVGEELLFRGAIQGEFGLGIASVLFGLAHIGGRRSIVFGVWVMVMGGVLGSLVPLTGGLLGAVVAHAVYDGVAISYTRWAVPDLARDCVKLEEVAGSRSGSPGATGDSTGSSGDEDGS